MIYYFAIRKCPHPVVIEIANDVMLKEHNRVFSQASHWAFNEDEKDKAMKWAGVRAVITGREDVNYPFYDRDTNTWVNPMSGRAQEQRRTEIPDPMANKQPQEAAVLDPVPMPPPQPVNPPVLPQPEPAPAVVAAPQPIIQPVQQRAPQPPQKPQQARPAHVESPVYQAPPVQPHVEYEPVPEYFPADPAQPEVIKQPEAVKPERPAQAVRTKVYVPSTPTETPNIEKEAVPVPSSPDPVPQQTAPQKEPVNSLFMTLDILRKRGYAFVEIKTVLNESFFAVLDDILYWSSNLAPSMFTPVYGSCDFRVRGTFNAPHDWNDLSDINRIMSGSDGLELSNIVISSHRNLIRDTDEFGLLKVLPRVHRTCMDDYVYFDHLFKGIKRTVDKDTAHSAFGQAESLSYEGKDDVYDQVLNSVQVVSVIPFFIHEEVKDPNIIKDYYRMYPKK